MRDLPTYNFREGRASQWDSDELIKGGHASAMGAQKQPLPVYALQISHSSQSDFDHETGIS